MPIEKMTEVPYPGVVPWLAVRKKINEIIEQGGGASVTVDDALSSESENPVQNKVITNALNGKPTLFFGNGEPGEEGALQGDLYVEETTGTMYACVSFEGPNKWEKLTRVVVQMTIKNSWAQLPTDLSINGITFNTWGDFYLALTRLYEEGNTYLILKTTPSDYESAFSMCDIFPIGVTYDYQANKELHVRNVPGAMFQMLGYQGTIVELVLGNAGVGFQGVTLVTHDEFSSAIGSVIMLLSPNTYAQNDVINSFDVKAGSLVVVSVSSTLENLLANSEAHFVVTGNTISLVADTSVTINDYDYGAVGFQTGTNPYVASGTKMVVVRGAYGSVVDLT